MGYIIRLLPTWILTDINSTINFNSVNSRIIELQQVSRTGGRLDHKLVRKSQQNDNGLTALTRDRSAETEAEVCNLPIHDEKSDGQ